ncbi:spore germination protein [Camelliibacillus cellulosilyticus]|uniref:Spore germination protein n=1 Tax=Camelliibacillus cellulosilyticus TaxID=2174486 RepID=A0ABV9GRB0_9BACL
MTLKSKRRKQLRAQKAGFEENDVSVSYDPNALFNNLNENVEKLQSIYANSYDVVFRHFLIAGKRQAVLIYIDGLADIQEIDQHVLQPLMAECPMNMTHLPDHIMNRLSVPNIKSVQTFPATIQHISEGMPLILVDGLPMGIFLGLQKWEKRSIEEPESEKVVRGPREGFIETLSVNTAMLRRRIISPKLKMQSMDIGQYSQTKVVVCYIEGLANASLIKEVTKRLKGIKIDGVVEGGTVEELIEDHPYSPFPQILTTERPDVVAASLLEGRAAILLSGTPFAMVAPVTFYSFMQTSEDYSSRYIVGTALRWLRYFLLVVSLLLPSLYVALITFHQEMVPTKLLIRMAASREQVPFPALVEAVIMEVTLEALREAGIRLPKQVGFAVSIVGVLVIGQAAIAAGIVSAPMVIVVAFTGIASFTIPRYSATYPIRLLRFPIMLLAGSLGLLGVILGVVTIVIHLCTLRSFGVPYLSPMAPMMGSEMRDVLVRAPWWKLNKRPRLTGASNKYRQAPGQKPNAPSSDKQ